MNPRIKNLIQDCNVNFLFGSGLSYPYLKLLGNIEALLTQLEASDVDKNKKSLIRLSIYKRYFDDVIKGNLGVLEKDPRALEVLNCYCGFLTVLNSILLRRKSTILGKEANIFTTNIDVFVEKALEESSLEFNDGF